jgi:hypothetical protein
MARRGVAWCGATVCEGQPTTDHPIPPTATEDAPAGLEYGGEEELRDDAHFSQLSTVLEEAGETASSLASTGAKRGPASAASASGEGKENDEPKAPAAAAAAAAAAPGGGRGAVRMDFDMSSSGTAAVAAPEPARRMSLERRKTPSKPPAALSAGAGGSASKPRRLSVGRMDLSEGAGSHARAMDSSASSVLSDSSTMALPTRAAGAGARMATSPPLTGAAAFPPSVPMHDAADAGVGGAMAATLSGSEAAALEMRPEEVDQDTLAARLTDKNWKTRREAYLQLRVLLEATGAAAEEGAGSDVVGPEVFEAYAHLLPKIVDDSNASALDAALDAALAFVEHARPAGLVGPRLAEALVPKVINRALPGRPSTLKKGQALLLKLMEVDTPEVAVAALLEGLGDKRPKVPPACLQAAQEGLRAFGPKHFPFKALKGQLKPLFESSQKAVRTAAMDLVVEVCRWVGMSPLKDIVDDLRPAQQKEIADATANVTPGQVQPTVGLRRYRGQAQAHAGPGAAGGGGAAAAGAGAGDGGAGGGGDAGGDMGFSLDPYELADPVDLLAKLSAPGVDFYGKLGAAKWSERVEALQFACKAVGDVPKLVPGDYAELVRAMKLQVGHSHFQVATGAIRLLGLLGSGLREKFVPYAPSVWGVVVGKAKDKKALTAATEAMDQLYGRALSLEAVLEDVDAGVDAKKATVPHTRVLVLEWVGRCLAASSSSSSAGPGTKGCKYFEVPATVKVSLAKTLVRCMEDSDPKVREATHATARRLLEASQAAGAAEHKAVLAVFETLRTTNKKAYDRLLADGVDVSSSGSSATAGSRGHSRGASSGDVGAATAKAAKPAARPASSRVGAGPGAAKKPALASSKASASAAASARKAAGGGLGGASSAAAAGGGTQDDGIDESAASSDPEEAATRLQEALKLERWEENVMAPLQGSKWMERKDALGRVREAVLALGPQVASGGVDVSSSSLLAALVAFLGEHSKKFKDANVNVVKEALEAALAGMQALVGDAPSAADKAAAASMVSMAVEKLLDKKLKETACGLLMAAVEVVGPAPVAARVIKGAAAAKAPALHAEAIGWLKACVTEFGASRAGVQALAAFAVSEVEGSSNPAVRKAGVELLGAMYRQIGPPLRSVALSDSIKPAVRTAVEQEFDKVGFNPGSAQKSHARRVKGDQAAGAAGAGGGAGGGLGLPRLDLTPQMKDVVTRLGSADGKNAWQARKVAIEEVMAACENSGRYVEANKAAAEVLKALRARLGDSQSNLKPLAAQAIADLVCSLDEASVPKYARLVAEALLNGAADNKKLMRDACIQAVDRILSVGKGPAVVEALLPQLATAMTHAVGRTELLQCLAKFFPLVTCDTAVLAAPLLDSLQDKTATARAAAETCLVPLLRSGVLKQQALNNGMRDFAPAVKRSLVAPLARVQAQAEAEAAAAGSGSSSASASQGGSEPASEQEDSGTVSTTGTASAAGAAAAATAPVGASTATGGSPAKKEEPPAAKPKGAAEEDGVVPSAATSTTGSALMKGNKGKAKREEDFRRMRWVTPPDDARPEDMEALKIAWTPMLSTGDGGALERLFPPSVGRKGFAVDPTVYVGGVEVLECVLEESLATYMENLDLIFRWLALRLCDKENVQVLHRVLELLVRSLQRLKDEGYALRDFEAAILVPHVLEKSGQGKERFRLLFRQAMRLVCDVYPFSKYAPFLVNALASKNLRTRVACLDELRRVLDFNASPLALLGKRGLREVARYLDSREPEVRGAALDVMLEVHERAGRDMSKLARATDGGLSDKGRALLEEKARDRERSAKASGGGSSSSSSSSREEPAAGLDRSGASSSSSTRIPGPSMGMHSRQSSVSSVNAAEAVMGEAPLASGNAAGSPSMVLSQLDGNLDLRLTSSGVAGGGSSNSNTSSGTSVLGSAKNPRAAPGGLLRSLSPRVNLRLDANPPEDEAGAPGLSAGSLGSLGAGGSSGAAGSTLFQFRTDDITYGDEPSLLEEAKGASAGSLGSTFGTTAMGFDATLTAALNDTEPPQSYLRLLSLLDAFLAAPAPLPETAPERAATMEALAVLAEPPKQPAGTACAASSEPGPLVLEEEALRARGDELVERVVEVLAKAFSSADPAAAAAAGVAPALQAVDAALAEAAARALTALYKNAAVVLQVTPPLLGKTLEEGLWRIHDPALTALAATGDKVASGLSQGMRKAMIDIFKSLPSHTCLAALLDSITRQRLNGVPRGAPSMQAAVSALRKVLLAERTGSRSFEGMDVARVVAPLAAFFGRTPEESAAVAQYAEADNAVLGLLEDLYGKVGRERLRSYLQMGGVDALDARSGLTRRLVQLAATRGEEWLVPEASAALGSSTRGGASARGAGAAAGASEGGGNDMAKLVADVLNVQAADNDENMKVRERNGRRGRGRGWACVAVCALHCTS